MTLDEARALDAVDPMRSLRERFQLPPGIIYLDGNSLGALPVATAGRVRAVIKEQWGDDLIASWNKHGWIDAPARIAAKLAPIVGAKPNELLIADSTSVCLFKALGAAVRARPDRRTIVTQADNFPTDLYVVQGLADMLGLNVKAMAAAEIASAIDREVAVITVTHVDYRSGAVHDMTAINDAARAAGALTVWDLSHSAGSIELDLAGRGCDLAVGCGYKYLNGGPGAPAFLFVAERLQDGLQSPIWGWMGHADPFAFEPNYRPAAGIQRFLTGTPSIIALAALEAGLETFAGVSIRDVESKAQRLASLFIDEVEARCGIDLNSQRDRSSKGSQVVVPHAQGYAVMQALIAHGVIGDFRPPELMRFGFAPLYTSYQDVWRAADLLGQILDSGEWDQPRFHARQKVT